PGLIQKLYDRKIAKTNSNKKLSWIRSVKACEKRPYYSLRRIWRASCIFDENCKLSAWSESYLKNGYPFEIIPDRKVSAEFLMQLHRDTFKGTEFDPGATPSGGFFASPYSYNLEDERAISTTSTAYTYINEVSSDLPVPICHFALNTPAESVFIPLTVSELPDAYSKVDRNRYDETKLYWATNMVSTLTKGYYYTMIDTVKVKALELEQKSKATISQYSKLSAKDFTSLLNANAIASITGINSLYQLLLEHHDNGYKLRYAQGHNPKFIPVERYNKEENLRKAKQND
ncbi:MAG: C69 family dipeptidase, partial [Succinivibrio sp.]|nr:C69 family dipeptidase [Succinivibrio sp.]